MLNSKVVVVQNYPPIVRIAAILFWYFAGLANTSARDLTLRAFAPNPSDGFAVVFTADSEPISALQFDLDFEGAGAFLFPAPGPAVRASNKMVVVQDAGPNRKRLMVYGLGRDGVLSGSLADIAIGSRNPNGTLRVRILNAMAVFGDGLVAPIGAQETTLTLLPDAFQRLRPSGVWNAASGEPSAVSGGSIMTLRGVDIGPATPMIPAAGVASSLGNVTVTFDGLRAHLLYAGPDQINLIAPWAITNRVATQIVVAHQSSYVAGASVPVADATPAIFTLTGDGTGGGAVINQDGSINSPLSPAPRESIIAIYGTGLGPLNPGGVDGGVAGLAYAKNAVSVTIGGLPAEVVYAGSAPSLVSGLFQVNCRIPRDVAPGASVEVRIQAGSSRSVAGVTIAVR